MYSVAVAVLRLCNHLLLSIWENLNLFAHNVAATAKMSSSLIDDRFRADAIMMRDMLRARVDSARTYVADKLGFDGWSRDLHDHMEVYAFLIPEEIYSDWALVGYLKKFIEDVFYAHFLDVSEASLMRDSSQDSIREAMGEDDYDGERYYVDWCGSRCREVELGSHIYFRISFDGWVSHRIREDPEVPERLRGISWEAHTDHPSQYEIKQWATVHRR